VTSEADLPIARITVDAPAAEAFPDVSVVITHTAVGTADAIAAEVDRRWQVLHTRWFGVDRAQIRSHPHVARYRDLSQRIGIDPNRHPPSIQALIERGLRNKPLGGWPRINPVVDAVNVTAVGTMVALGVFDADRITGSIRLAMSRGTETFWPLGANGAVQIEPDRLVLADDERVLSLFAYRDGIHQAVQPTTRRLLLLACVVEGVSAYDAAAALQQAARLIAGEDQP
jgi:DNA/RNA-binding domain of Phe-tRNA-synthetase-like protein